MRIELGLLDKQTYTLVLNDTLPAKHVMVCGIYNREHLLCSFGKLENVSFGQPPISRRVTEPLLTKANVPGNLQQPLLILCTAQSNDPYSQ